MSQSKRKKKKKGFFVRSRTAGYYPTQSHWFSIMSLHGRRRSTRLNRNRAIQRAPRTGSETHTGPYFGGGKEKSMSSTEQAAKSSLCGKKRKLVARFSPAQSCASQADKALQPQLRIREKCFSNQRTLTITTPRGFSLAQSVCSYGYFGLCPNEWIPAPPTLREDAGEYTRPYTFGTPHAEEFAVVASVTQPDRRGDEDCIVVRFVGGSVPATPEHVAQVTAQISRVLRLGWKGLDAFHAVHPEARARKFGRTFRSPTLFEDMVKTLTNCNMKFSGTVRMNRLLCACVGHASTFDGSAAGNAKVTAHAFPTPQQIVDAHATLQERCKLGYRTSWIVDLAQRFLRGDINPAAIEQEPCSVSTNVYVVCPVFSTRKYRCRSNFRTTNASVMLQMALEECTNVSESFRVGVCMADGCEHQYRKCSRGTG
eukprot:m.384617 g.384617  ORF g.384617 m.384617 type:complete len:426 (+) comp20996_c0_seq9:210-1487(+)